MGIFYREGRHKKILRFLKKKGFSIREGGRHVIATHPDDTSIEISLPRHKTLSNGVTEDICKKLVELGYDKDEIIAIL